MCRFWRFLSVLFLTCCVGISGVVTPARAESVIDMCEKCSYAIWFNANVSNADKCDDYANYGTSLNTLCRNTYNSSSNVTSACQNEGSECTSGGNGAYCESGKFGSPLQEGNSCTVGTQTGTYQSGCCTNLSDPAPTCYHGTCSSDSDCTTNPYTECNTTTGCCQSYTHYYWCEVGTSVSTSGFSGCTVQTGLGDFTGYAGTQSSAFAACRTPGTTYQIAYHIETDSNGDCLHNNGSVGSGGIMVYSITSCDTCSSGTRVSYQWAMDHRSFYGIGNMLCSDEDYTHQGTSFDDVYVCVNCTTGYSAWTDVSGQNYQSATKTDCATASYTTYYRCKKNYYSAGGYSDTDDPSKLNCQPCPPIGDLATYTEDPASSTIHECCARSGATGSDTLGSYKLKSSCCW